MIWQIARVDASDLGRLKLAFSTPSMCSRCSRGEGCGAGVFGGLILRGVTRVELPFEAAFAAGEWVRVGLSSRLLAFAALLHYGLPLAGFLAGAAAAHLLTDHSAWQDGAALAGGLAGLLIVVFVARRHALLEVNPVVERLSCTRDDSNSYHL